jgi:hypothetical protein
MENSKRVFEKYYCKEHDNSVKEISHLLLAMLAQKQPKITYGTRVEVDACIHWAENPLSLSVVL